MGSYFGSLQTFFRNFRWGCGSCFWNSLTILWHPCCYHGPPGKYYWYVHRYICLLHLKDGYWTHCNLTCVEIFVTLSLYLQYSSGHLSYTLQYFRAHPSPTHCCKFMNISTFFWVLVDKYVDFHIQYSSRNIFQHPGLELMFFQGWAIGWVVDQIWSAPRGEQNS